MAYVDAGAWWTALTGAIAADTTITGAAPGGLAFVVRTHAFPLLDGAMADRVILGDLTGETDTNAMGEDVPDAPGFKAGLAAFVRWSTDAEFATAHAALATCVRRLRARLAAPAPGIGGVDAVDVVYQWDQVINGVTYAAAYVDVETRHP